MTNQEAMDLFGYIVSIPAAIYAAYLYVSFIILMYREALKEKQND